jgi:hypothetical protein
MMVRIRFLLGLTVALTLPGGAVRAQFGFPVGQFGWGGWSSTVQGDIAHGLGSMATGMGQYNAQTAVAKSVNADTVMRLNQYVFQAQQEANRRQFERQNRRQGRVTSTAAETADRLRNRPEASDIERGDALNVLLDDLTSPAVLHSSGLRFAGGTIPSALVREIPFRNAAQAVTISIDQLTNRERFPTFLRSEALTAEREAFVNAVHEAAGQAREQDEISPEAIRTVQATGRALYQKAKSAEVGATRDERNEALTYLKGMSGLARMLENPDTIQALKELKKIETTQVANLVAFMQAYNLRFGPADSAAQRKAYRTLYPILKADRDQIYTKPETTAALAPSNPKANPAEVFQGLDESAVIPPSPTPNP